MTSVPLSRLEQPLSLALFGGIHLNIITKDGCLYHLWRCDGKRKATNPYLSLLMCATMCPVARLLYVFSPSQCPSRRRHRHRNTFCEN